MKQEICVYYKDTPAGREWYRGDIQLEDGRHIYGGSEQQIMAHGWKKMIVHEPVLFADDDFSVEIEQVNKLVKEYPRLQNALSPVIDTLVYHYTTWEVLFNGILNRGNIDREMVIFRAFSSMFMNDSTEGLLIPNSMMIEEDRVIRSKYSTGTSFNRQRIWTEGAKQQRTKKFSVSFSKNPDSLPMWQCYGHTGKGIAIGIDAMEIWKQGYTLYDCIYDEGIIEILGAALFAHVGEKYDVQYDLLGKDRHFEYEQECRVTLGTISPHTSVKTRRDQFLPVKYDIKKGYIVPYVDVILPCAAIKEIWIGPTSNFEMARASLDGWLRSVGLNNIKIRKSTAPFVG